MIKHLTKGHKSSAHATLWAILFLHEHPEYYQKAKAEQVEILKRASSPEGGLDFKETKRWNIYPRFIQFETAKRSGADLVEAKRCGYCQICSCFCVWLTLCQLVIHD